MNVLGIMSGTSLGGVDYVLCRSTPKKFLLVDHWEVPYPAHLNANLHLAAAGRATSHQVGQWHHDLGRFYAQGVRKGLGKRKVDLAGLHGQTIFHSGKSPMATLQIGEPSYLALELGCPVISNFRSGDLAVGGQGAPLATAFHQKVFAKKGMHVCVNNLGGISNVTSLDWRKGPEPTICAFDTGPANMLMDLICSGGGNHAASFDRNGRGAAKGEIQAALLKEALKHPYFRRPPPKSTGREEFGEIFLEKIFKRSRRRKLSRNDALATLAEITSQSIVLNYRLHLKEWPDEIVLCGGGSRNSHLVSRINAAFVAARAGSRIVASEERGWPSQAIEAAAFAFLACKTMRGEAGNLPETTGARRGVILGSVTRL